MNKEKKLKIYYTSDLHGYFYPTTYTDNTLRAMGLFQCASAFQKDEHTLVIDGGDMLQGSAFANYCRNCLHSPEIMAEIMNDCGYDYYTLGNHDFNYGQDYQAAYREKMHASCVCENVRSEDGRKLYPCRIHTMPDGLRVGIAGVVTDFVNVWEKKENLAGIRVTDAFEAASEALEEMRGKTDLTICIYHGGLEKDPDTGELLSDTSENIACRICEQLDYDLLLTGHQHLSIPGRYWGKPSPDSETDKNPSGKGTFVVQPPENGKEYVCLEITVCGGHKEIRSRNLAAEPVSAQNVLPKKYTDDSSVNTQPDKHADALARNVLPDKYAGVEAQVQRWLDEPAGRLSRALLPEDKLQMALHGSGIADFVNRVQLYYTGAQLSVTSLANDVTGYRELVSNRDIISTCPFPNTLIVCRITGRQLRTVMEHSAEYFAVTPEGELTVSEPFLKPKIAHYNYDYYAGVEYEIQPYAPAGQRIRNLTYQGRPVEDGDSFTMAVNNYRYSGTGGYETYRECPKLHEVSTEMTELISDYFRTYPYLEV